MRMFGLAANSVYRFRQRFFPTSMVTNSFNFAMLSHPGRVRKGNEDTCAASLDAGAFVVCDGMGGAAGGEVASRMATDAFLKALTPADDETPRTSTPDHRIAAAIHAANQAVYQLARQSLELRGMGTTLVALLLQPSGNGDMPFVTLAHVGDSRCYVFRRNQLMRLTQDHSLVEEQLRMGEITAVEAENHPMRNIITRAVGSHALVEPEILRFDPKPGDIFLLASDGLTRELADRDIAATVTRAVAHAADRPLNLQSLCQTLIDQANDAGGGDNITVLLLQMSAE
jgi:serine/threonine protein phosphatase PrpC